MFLHFAPSSPLSSPTQDLHVLAWPVGRLHHVNCRSSAGEGEGVSGGVACCNLSFPRVGCGVGWWGRGRRVPNRACGISRTGGWELATAVLVVLVVGGGQPNRAAGHDMTALTPLASSRLGPLLFGLPFGNGRVSCFFLRRRPVCAQPRERQPANTLLACRSVSPGPDTSFPSVGPV
jgi:hypothetical protein